MGSEEKFWLHLWQSVILGIVLVAGSIASCTYATDKLISQDIKNGAAPLEAKCAHNESQTTCTIVASKNPPYILAEKK